jgi:hypothetical protein
MEDMIGIGVMVAIIILASSVHKFVNLKNKASIPSEAEIASSPGWKSWTAGLATFRRS